MTKIAEPVDVNDVSRIAETTSLAGSLAARSDIRVDGRIEGKLFSEGRVVVGEKAVIEGTVLCSDLDLWGEIRGDVYVKNLLSLKSPARVTGSIHVRKLQVEMGASVNGSCRMITEEDFDACLEGIGAPGSGTAEEVAGDDGSIPGED